MRAIRISQKQLDKMTSSIKLSDLMRHVCKDLPKVGRNKKALCPWHKERTPSLCVNDELQIYHCFGCGEHGSHLQFIARTHFNGNLDSRLFGRDYWHKEQCVPFMLCVRKLSQITGIKIVDNSAKA